MCHSSSTLLTPTPIHVCRFNCTCSINMSQAYISAKLQSKVYNIATKGQDSPLKWKLNDRYCSPPRYELLNFLSFERPSDSSFTSS